MESDVARSIRLPKAVWNALDEEAARCRRSATKQLEAILLTYYGIEDVEVDRAKLAKAALVGELTPRSTRKTNVVTAAPSDSKTTEKRKKA
ncbi:MAG: hypothetical protein M3209_09800 [Acidobacteriota bacterium]|nr:hypothetical protein [Acidobacteriota bacterium]